MSSGESVRPYRHRRRRVAVVAAAALLVTFAPAIGVDASPSHRGGGGGHSDDRDDKLLFFASDGLRQDAVEQYAKQGVVPGFRDLLKNGAKASDNGLLTQSPPNTGAGWFTLTTGAWPGVAGSTNNTFHVNGQPFGNRTAAFDAGVLQAETLAQAADAAARRSPRSSGQAVVAVRRKGRRSTSATSVLVAVSRPTTSAPSIRRRSPRPSVCSSTIPPGSPVRQRSHRPRPHWRPAGPTCRSPTARRWRCACG